MLIRLLFVALVLPSVLPCAFAAEKETSPPLPPPATKTASAHGITEYVLPNGLKLLLLPDSSKDTVTVSISYLVGSRHEGYGERGMAHLLEHLLFKGTPRHPNIYQELTARGTRPNGATGYDSTAFYETFPASPDNIRWALDLEADRMVHSTFTGADLHSEMTVVRNELEMGENSPQEVLFERLLSTAYLWHNYGKSPIGTRSDLEGVSIDRLRAFYARYYQPDNAVLVVGGKFDTSQVLTLASDLFGRIPRPARKLEQTYTAEPVQDGERSVVLRRMGDLQLVEAGYHVPAGAHPDFAPLELLTQVIGDTPGRLSRALVEHKKAASTFGFTFQMREPGMIVFGARLRKDYSIEDAHHALMQTLDAVTSTPITTAELERARAQLLHQTAETIRSSERLALELGDWAAMGDWRLFFVHRSRVREATLDDVNRVAKQYLIPSNRTMARFMPEPAPQRATIPPLPDVAAMVNAYRDEEVLTAGATFDPSPANIEKETIHDELPVGLKLELLPKRTRGQAVYAVLNLRLGDAQTLQNHNWVNALTARMLQRGTAKRTRQELQDALDRLQTTISVHGSSNLVSVRVGTTRESLPEALRLVAEVLRQPAFPRTEFDRLKQSELLARESRRSDPESVAYLQVQQHFYPYPEGDVRRYQSMDEQIEEIRQITVNDLRDFHHGFYGASHGELAVVGDFEPTQLRSLVGTLFNDWQSPQRYSRLPWQYKARPPIAERLQVPDKANASFVAGTILPVSQKSPDYPALMLGTYLIGGGFLNSRLATRIRQQEGLSYSIESDLVGNSFDPVHTFLTTAICAPENIERLETAFRQEIRKVLESGFTTEEVASAKNGWLEAQRVSRAQDDELASQLARFRYDGRSLAWQADLENRVAALTPDQIRDALRKYISLPSFSIVKVGDFERVRQPRN